MMMSFATAAMIGCASIPKTCTEGRVPITSMTIGITGRTGAITDASSCSLAPQDWKAANRLHPERRPSGLCYQRRGQIADVGIGRRKGLLSGTSQTLGDF